MLSFNGKNEFNSFKVSTIGHSHKNLLFFMKITKNKCFGKNSDFDKFANILWLSTVSVQIIKKTFFCIFYTYNMFCVVFLSCWKPKKLAHFAFVEFSKLFPCYFIQISNFKIKSLLLNVLENSAQLKNCFLLLQLSSWVFSSMLLGLHNPLLGFIAL